METDENDLLIIGDVTGDDLLIIGDITGDDLLIATVDAIGDDLLVATVDATGDDLQIATDIDVAGNESYIAANVDGNDLHSATDVDGNDSQIGTKVDVAGNDWHFATDGVPGDNLHIATDVDRIGLHSATDVDAIHTATGVDVTRDVFTEHDSVNALNDFANGLQISPDSSASSLLAPDIAASCASVVSSDGISVFSSTVTDIAAGCLPKEMNPVECGLPTAEVSDIPSGAVTNAAKSEAASDLNEGISATSLTANFTSVVAVGIICKHIHTHYR